MTDPTLERIKQIETDINDSANIGYEIDELNPADAREMDGFVWAIENMLNAFDNEIVDTKMDKTVIGTMTAEILENAKEEIYTHMICSGVDLLYSMLENEVRK